ncbi:MAG: nitrate ABC transporter substrate-binding protein [Clostridia bacterium BRH_c25]|nr:MAG: nitrate ABC transporter substrate-binding protein [Clostridia bacterium BRH_c25]
MMEKIEGINIFRSAKKEGQSFQILEDISFSAQQGEIVCILGPSGCGKSTLLRIMGGFDLPDRGSVLRDGTEVTKPSSDAILIFQDFNQLLPWKTVIENVIYPLSINRIGNTKKEREAAAVRYLNMAGLNDSFHSYPHQLSGGMKQKAALARALVLTPSILLMDEPFGSLDALTRKNLQVLLEDIWRETGVTIVFVTHDVQEAIILGDKIIIMDKNPGRILNEVPNNLERPRDIGSPGFIELYDRIYSMLQRGSDQ